MNEIVTLPFMIGNTGRWWGTNKLDKRQEEIDIMSVVDENALLCECKWGYALQGVDVLQKLMKRGTLFPYRNQYFMVFAKNGFTQEASGFSKTNTQMKLVSFGDIYVILFTNEKSIIIINLTGILGFYLFTRGV